MLARVGKKDPALNEDTMRFIIKEINRVLAVRFVPMEKTHVYSVSL